MFFFEMEILLDLHMIEPCRQASTISCVQSEMMVVGDLIFS